MQVLIPRWIFDITTKFIQLDFGYKSIIMILYLYPPVCPAPQGLASHLPATVNNIMFFMLGSILRNTSGPRLHSLARPGRLVVAGLVWSSRCAEPSEAKRSIEPSW